MTLEIRAIFKNWGLGGFNQSYQVKPTSAHIIKSFRVYHKMINVKKHEKHSTCAVRGYTHLGRVQEIVKSKV